MKQFREVKKGRVKAAPGKASGRAAPLLKRPFISNVAIAAAAYIALTIILTAALQPERFDMKVGEIAKTTVVATKDVLDADTTNRYRENAAATVEKQYSRREGAREQSIELLDSIFLAMEDARALGEALRLGTGRFAQPAESSARPAVTRAPDGKISREQYDNAAKSIPQLNMSQWQMTILMNMDADTLASVKEQTSLAVLEAMEGFVIQDQADAVINSIQRRLQNVMSSDHCWNIALPVARVCLVPNMVINQEETERKQDEARASIEPVYYKQGQNIVTAGSRITQQQINVMKSLGLIRGDTRFDGVLFGGVCLFVALVLLVYIIHLSVFEREVLAQPKLQLLMLALTLITIGLTLAVQTISPYLAPLSVGALLAASMLPSTLAWALNVITAILVGFVFRSSSMFSQQMLHVIVHGMLGSAIGVYVLANHPRRLTTLLAGLYVSLFNLVGIFALGFITNNSMSSILKDALFSFGSGMFAAVLSMGLQPALEWAFNLVTPAKLLELANPNHPLLRRMMLEAPGTYQHSLMVANLAESAADAIGANALLVRVGAYYHDIGKLRRPQFFKENQLGDNPHDMLDPQSSAAIVLSHVPDGLSLAVKHHLPPMIKDLISQHHGDTPVVYFYKQACKLNPEGTADISKFRYDQPRPKTAEAAILMLADSVEAAVRSIQDPTGEKMQQGIKSIVQQKMADGQLDDTPINFHDLNLICKAFASALNGLYHQRIDYPAFDIRTESKSVDGSILVYAAVDGNRSAAPAAAVAPQAILSGQSRPEGQT